MESKNWRNHLGGQNTVCESTALRVQHLGEVTGGTTPDLRFLQPEPRQPGRCCCNPAQGGEVPLRLAPRSEAVFEWKSPA